MELILPSSANWYCSRIIDSNQDGIAVVGAKNSLDIWDIKESPARHIENIIAHQDRIIGVSLCHLDCRNSIASDLPRCCSAGEDGIVRMWNLNSKEVLKEHSLHKNKLTAIHWSQTGEGQYVASGDDKGCVVIWNVLRDEMTSWYSESPHRHIFCLSFSQRVEHLLAVGYKTGAVIILDVSNKIPKIVQRLKGQDEEIHCICWAPALTDESISTETDSAATLATSCRDKTIRLWNLVKGQTVATLKVPSSGGNYSRQRSEEHGSKLRVWMALCWPKSDQLVTSGLSGELLAWNINNLSKPRWQPLMPSSSCRGHSRIVFSISVGGEDLNTLMSVSMDRQMIIWELSSLSAKQSISSLGGFVYAIATSPLNPDRVAVGAGDCLIRVWNLASVQSHNVQTYWQGIKAKVTALSWHPNKEGWLAYGTEDGRVGVYDVLSARLPLISDTYHKKTVCVVSWGPDCYPSDADAVSVKVERDYCLYSVGDGVILQHDMNNVSRPAVNIDTVVSATNIEIFQRCHMTSLSAHTTMAWTADCSHVALGNDDGSIDVYEAPNLKIVCKLLVNKKLITSLRWHPRYTVESGSKRSACDLWLAVGSSESIIHVFDLTKPLMATNAVRPVVITESLRQIDGHSNRVTGLCWSTHHDGLLATASFDWTSQVWDVKFSTLVALYSGHNGRVFCVEWSASDPDAVFTGSDDHSVHVWHLSQHQWTEGNDKKKMKHRIGSKTKRSASKPQAESAHSPNSKVTSTDVVVGGDSVKSPSCVDSEFSANDLDEIQRLLERKRIELEQANLIGSLKSGCNVGIDETVNEDIVSTVDSSPVNQALDILPDNNSSTEVPEMTHSPNGAPVHIESDESGEDDNRPLADKVLKSPINSCDNSKKDTSRDKKKRRAKSLFPKSSMADNRGKLLMQQDCVELANYLYAKEHREYLADNLLHLGCFVNRKNTYALYRHEESYHLENGNMDQFVTLQVFKGCDISSNADLLRHPLTDYYLALTANHLANKEMFEKYARQLNSDGLYHKSATILLSIFQVYEAIRVLASNGLYKDAICLAQVRLSPSDPVLKQLFISWAANLAKDGNYELAAKCYLTLRMPHKAASCLVKRSEVSALRSAIEILLAAEHVDDAKVFAQKYVRESILHFDWSSAEEVIRLNSSFRVLALPMVVYKFLVLRLSKFESLQAAINSAEHISPAEDSFEKKPFFFEVAGCWENQWNINTAQTESLLSFCTQLEAMLDAKQSQPSATQVVLEASLQLSLGILRVFLHDLNLAFECLSKAIECCLNANYKDLAFGLCQLIQPKGQENSDFLRAVIHQLSGINEPIVTRVCESLVDERPISTVVKQCTSVDRLLAFRALSIVEYYIEQLSVSTDAHVLAELSDYDATVLCEALLWDTPAACAKLADRSDSAEATPNDNHSESTFATDSCLSQIPNPLRSADLLQKLVDSLSSGLNCDEIAAKDRDRLLENMSRRLRRWTCNQ